MSKCLICGIKVDYPPYLTITVQIVDSHNSEPISVNLCPSCANNETIGIKMIEGHIWFTYMVSKWNRALEKNTGEENEL